MTTSKVLVVTSVGGADFQGLPLGQVTRGDVTRQEEWVGPDPNAFELDVATRDDADGNPRRKTRAVGGACSRGTPRRALS